MTVGHGSGKDVYAVIRVRKHDILNARTCRGTGRKEDGLTCSENKSNTPGLCGMQESIIASDSLNLKLWNWVLFSLQVSVKKSFL